jgi:predicted Ser/Thr protein kinase
MVGLPDLAETLLLLPGDAKLLAVNELAPRLRDILGPIAEDEVVITRPGFRMTARQVPSPLAALLAEFRTASRLTDAVHRFSRSHGQDPQEILDLSFDALLSCVVGGILVDASSAEAQVLEPRLASGQAFAGMEVEELVRGLDDTEVYRVKWLDGRNAALKLARDGRAVDSLAHEAHLLQELNGQGVPHLFGQGTEDGCAWIAIEWRHGVGVSVAAQQARSMGDRARLASILSGVLDAYGRLYERGILHGDIHTGNILVEDDGQITLLDFGRASRVGGPPTDQLRVGVPQFYDPEMAAALLKGALPPAATPHSEQYALAILAYQLLSGLYAIDPSADQQELLSRIVTRPPLPFVARGVEAWPPVEHVLGHALAKQPEERFPTTAAFARAFDCASRIESAAPVPTAMLEETLPALRIGEIVPGFTACAQAWLALRAAQARSDEELLAAADVAIAQASPGVESWAAWASISRARSDRMEEQNAINGFVEAALLLEHGTARSHALQVAAQLLQGAEARGLDVQPLRRWATLTLEELWPQANPDLLHASLALNLAGVVRLPADTRARLDALPAQSGSAWLWALAHDIFAWPAYLNGAEDSKVPRTPLLRALRELRLHQLTGNNRWLASARHTASSLASQPSSFACALIHIELEAPARAILPPWRLRPEEGGE